MNFDINEGYRKGFDTRGDVISFTSIMEVINTLEEKAPYYYEMIKKGNIPTYQQIFRGVGNLSISDKFKLYDPQKYTRHSANTLNYYTEIIDNSKHWEEYPNRSSSLVGTTDIEKAREYGHIYHIIPLEENSKFGVCPRHDIWYSFEFALSELRKLFNEDMAIPTAVPDFKNLAGLNNFLKTKFDLSKDADYKELMKKVILDERVFKLLNRQSTWNNSRYDYTKEELLKIQKKWGTFLNYLEYLLSPKWNGFSTLLYNRYTTLPTDKEVWTDSECFLIEHSLHEKILLILQD